MKHAAQEFHVSRADRVSILITLGMLLAAAVVVPCLVWGPSHHIPKPPIQERP
jgi:hypothetical protein